LDMIYLTDSLCESLHVADQILAITGYRLALVPMSKTVLKGKAVCVF